MFIVWKKAAAFLSVLGYCAEQVVNAGSVRWRERFYQDGGHADFFGVAEADVNGRLVRLQLRKAPGRPTEVTRAYFP